MITKPSIPKGTRDFTPAEMLKRNFIFDTIKSVFQKYGYLPIETPAMEKLSTLTGKYGEEGDRLIFKILPRGEKLNFRFTSDNDSSEVKDENTEVNSDVFAEFLKSKMGEALRYDLTVPFARFVVQHQNELTFPFKRYQIQPVWRADRPQRGRYREFYQCDVDVIGSDSLLNEVELIQIMDEVFGKLGINVTIKINNRKVLAGIAEAIGEQERMIPITVALDKIDKIGKDGVVKELKENDFSDETIDKLAPLLDFTGSNKDKIDLLTKMLSGIEIGKKGIEELVYLINTINSLEFKNSKVDIDITLARGLNYYTGAIFEVVCDDFPSSICGGGRYDDLTGIFGLNNVSGVGISFGADRIYDVMLDQNLFPEQVSKNLSVLLVNFGDKEAAYCLQLLSKLRANDITAELYPDTAKMKKQMKYADDRGALKVVIIGSEEMETGIMSVKDMVTGEQQKMNIEELINSLK